MKKFILFFCLLFISCKEKIKNDIKTKNLNLKKAEICRDSGNIDSAYIYYTKAKEELIKQNDSLEAARAITNIAIIQCNKGDYYGSISSSIEAEKLLYEKQDSISKEIKSSNYNSIAISSKNLKNYNDAITYYKHAIANSSQKENTLTYYNNIGDTYLEQDKAILAKPFFEIALRTTDSIDYARALNNLAKAKFLESEAYNPVPELQKAWQIRIRQKDDQGVNSSLATFADYYIKKDKSKALFFTQEMYNIASQNKSPDDRLESLQKLVILDPINYSKIFEKYISLKDSIETERIKAKDKFAIIKFDVEKKNKENAEKETAILRLVAIVIGLFSLLILGVFWFRKRKKTLELKVKNTELRYSKKVHDVVANGIYQVMTKIENQENFDKEKALDELEFVYEKSRDISHDQLSAKEQNFNERLSQLIASFNNEKVKTYIAGNDSDLWNGFSKTTEEEIYQVIRELLVNMKKHSHAERVVLKFERKNNTVSIGYSDNGIGVAGNVIHKNGRNVVSRIQIIAGDVIFDTKTEKGLKVNIVIPVS
ncbi:tetratricopeptide repeat-containing sensor histidine kinase [Chryseobacterium sp.]|uniref:tetratricopeptide repeat-containing sensor histidine kinase n=1 Tax=Chryseobacterium sp. TaxID=1871047 RepID=UPI0025B7EC46|nr:tetratricopeptide repeat-containing sensor histidine kinase [Chryseobacterium sp.]